MANGGTVGNWLNKRLYWRWIPFSDCYGMVDVLIMWLGQAIEANVNHRHDGRTDGRLGMLSSPKANGICENEPQF